MADCSCVDDEDTTKKDQSGERENGDTAQVQLQLQAQHRRSKSASEKKLDIPKGGVPHVRKEQNESNDLQPSRRRRRPEGVVQDQSVDIKSKNSSTNLASLESDIGQLQLRLQQEKSMRVMLERAMGRASSTLSPGHMHFATQVQTKELITEIELLEEEVAKHEQHILSLYRSIFEQCATRPPSEQSSSMAAPAHMKHDSRKQKRSRKRTSLAHSKSRHASVLSGKTNIQLEKIHSDPTKAHEKVLNTDKTSDVRILKEHLHQCPSKLSEEMVKCMAAVYSGVRSAASANPKKYPLPLLSRSSTNNILPQLGVIEDRGWSCKSMIEISWISTDKNQFSRASCAINNYRVLVEQLERVKVNQMESNAQIAFWINVYNSLIMHAYLAYGIPHSSLRRFALFHKAAYNIDGHVISASAIEHSIFGFHTPLIGWWLETILSTAMRKKYGEETQVISSKFGLPTLEPLVCFALCTGAFSDPMLKVYKATSTKDELQQAKKEFLQCNVVVKKTRKVFLPKVLERFAKESFISGSDDLLKWVMDNVDKKLRDSIQQCFDHKRHTKAEWLPYSSRFRYVFSKDLMDEPWWG